MKKRGPESTCKIPVKGKIPIKYRDGYIFPPSYYLKALRGIIKESDAIRDGDQMRVFCDLLNMTR